MNDSAVSLHRRLQPPHAGGAGTGTHDKDSDVALLRAQPGVWARGATVQVVEAEGGASGNRQGQWPGACLDGGMI